MTSTSTMEAEQAKDGSASHHVTKPTSLISRLFSSLGTLLAIGLTIFGFWFGLAGGHGVKNHADEAPREILAVPVDVADVVTQDIQGKIAIIGTLHGQEEFVIVPKVEGRLIELDCDVGDVIKSGDIMARIDDTDFILQLNEAKRALEQELSKLGLTEIPAGEINFESLPSVTKAAAQRANTQQRLDRILQLFSRNAITESERQAVEAEHSVADSEYRQALLDAKTILATARLRAATVETAQQKLNDTAVRVPSIADNQSQQYIVTKRNVSTGQMVYGAAGMSTELFEVAIISPIELQATLPERFRGQIEVGQQVLLSVEGHPGNEFSGQLTRISPSVDRDSRTYQIEALFPNDDQHLSPGSFAKAVIVSAMRTNVVSVPEEAIVSYAGVQKVFVVDGDKVKEVIVTRGKDTKLAPLKKHSMTLIEVQGDLKPGQQVVITGQLRLANGVPITIKANKENAGPTVEPVLSE